MRYRLHRRLVAGLAREADIVFIGARTAVMVDGCFWHGCPEHFRAPATHTSYWADKVARNSARDRATDAAFTNAGWVVLRVWEHEIRRDASSCAARIQRTVVERRAARDGLAPRT
jgi:DNA mismatch endonuclease (patch repair protein)